MNDSIQTILAREVLQLRAWQHQVNESLKAKALGLAVHMAFGHEAIAVAVSHMLEDSDRLVLSHRNIAYNLARAGDLRPLYDEYKGLPSGLGGGRMGTMNLANPARGVAYTSSILGNNFCVACGLALGFKLKHQAGLVTVLTGDGAMEEGTFYESLDIAQSKGLRVLFIVENNQCAMSSTIPERRCAIKIDRLCQAFGVSYDLLTGNLVFDYAARLQELRRRIMETSVPVCIEVDLLNLYRHAGATPGFPGDPMIIDLKNGLVVREDKYDPVYVLKQHLPADEYAALEQPLLAQARAWSA